MKKNFKPQQTRSKVLVEAILESGRMTFGRLGFEAATTNHIAERAGVSIGSLYRYFRDKNSLLELIIEQIIVGNREEFKKRWLSKSGEPLPSLVKDVSELAFETLDSRKDILRTLYKYLFAFNKMNQLFIARRKLAHEMAEYLKNHYPESVNLKTIEDQLYFLINAYTGVILSLVYEQSSPVESQEISSNREFQKAALTHLSLRTLGLQPGPSASPFQ